MKLNSLSSVSDGMAVNLAASTIFTANCCAVNRWVHRLMTLHDPLQQMNINKGQAIKTLNFF